MDLVSYRGIQMRVIQSLPHVRTVELDESRSSYRWTRWDLSFIVTYEPTALSTLQIGLADGQVMPPDTKSTPPITKNPDQIQLGDTNRTMPGVTDGQIRRFLEYPRGILIIRAVNNIPAGTPTVVVLQSPATGFDRDANNGPFCKVNSIQEVAGDRLWQIHLTFTTYIYEDSLASGGSPPVIISNRWATTTDTNELHLTDRITEGIVHFRADQLANGVIIADTFRKAFASFTVPSGFQRKKVVCTTAPQGNMVRYRIVDREQPYQQKTDPGSGQVRLEYIERSWMWRGSAGRVVAAAAVNHVPAYASLYGLPAYLAFRALDIANSAVGALGRNLPKRYKTVIAKAWGNRFANRAFIVQRAMQLSQARIGVPFDLLPFTQEMSVSYHSALMMAQVEQTISWSFNEPIFSPTQALNLAGLIFGGGTLGLGDVGFAGFAGATGDALAQDTGQAMLLKDVNLLNPPFPNSAGTHGTWPSFDSSYLSRIAAQTLETIGQAPASPP